MLISIWLAHLPNAGYVNMYIRFFFSKITADNIFNNNNNNNMVNTIMLQAT